MEEIEKHNNPKIQLCLMLLELTQMTLNENESQMKEDYYYPEVND